MIYTKVLGVSSCSIYDTALIKGTWYSLTSDDFRCETHFRELAKRSDAEIAINHERKRRGCGVMLDAPKICTEDLEFYSCLCHENFQHPNFSQLIYLQEAYKRGTLPFEGCLVDQPAQILEIFSILDQLQLERETENQKKAANEQKKANQPKVKRPKTR